VRTATHKEAVSEICVATTSPSDSLVRIKTYHSIAVFVAAGITIPQLEEESTRVVYTRL
jgi:hypothetical protein